MIAFVQTIENDKSSAAFGPGIKSPTSVHHHHQGSQCETPIQEYPNIAPKTRSKDANMGSLGIVKTDKNACILFDFYFFT